MQRCVRSFSSISQGGKKIAVIFSGSGVYDGTEITEGVSTLIHLSAGNATASVYAPNKNSMHTINHMDGTEMDSVRNVMIESSRISRGSITDLASLDASKYDGLIIPGGFGAAKNLSTFATEGADMNVDEDVKNAILNFRAADKPIGLCCIAPTIVAAVLGGNGVEVTLGQSKGDAKHWPYSGAAGACEVLGAKHFDKDVNDVHVDFKMKVVTSPAYMYNGSPIEIHNSVGNMVNKVLEMC
jgi:enhancing lycopene biosynthesis protein 2